MYFIFVKILLVSAKNGTDFYGNLEVYKKMTHVGHSENYLR